MKDVEMRVRELFISILDHFQTISPDHLNCTLQKTPTFLFSFSKHQKNLFNKTDPKWAQEYPAWEKGARTRGRNSMWKALSSIVTLSGHRVRDQVNFPLLLGLTNFRQVSSLLQAPGPPFPGALFTSEDLQL